MIPMWHHCTGNRIYNQTSNISHTLVGNELRCSWSIACWRCSNYIFIRDLTHSFNGLGKDNCKTRWESFKFGDLGHLISEILRLIKLDDPVDWSTCIIKLRLSNPLWPPSDIIWHYRSWSTSVQVVACCLKQLTLPITYQWGSVPFTREQFCREYSGIFSENYMMKITATHPSSQWVNLPLNATSYISSTGFGYLS